MGNDKIGYQGTLLDEKIYKKIEVLREKYADLPIAWILVLMKYSLQF